MIGVFARADHPTGWGFVPPDEELGRAHGWSVLLVRCADGDELEAVASHLAYPGTRLPDEQRQAAWYGGRFDLLFSFDGEPQRRWWDLDAKPVLSVGDNRCLSIFDAADVLSSDGWEAVR